MVDRWVAGEPFALVMRLVPARCKVGTLIPVQVEAPRLGENASFYLPIGAERRSALFAFFKQACGLVG